MHHAAEEFSVSQNERKHSTIERRKESGLDDQESNDWQMACTNGVSLVHVVLSPMARTTLRSREALRITLSVQIELNHFSSLLSLESPHLQRSDWHDLTWLRGLAAVSRKAC
jgi:hypothetical protein